MVFIFRFRQYPFNDGMHVLKLTLANPIVKSDKSGNLRSRLFRNRLVQATFAGGLQHRNPLTVGVVRNPANRDLANFSRRNIDNALEGDGVIRIVDQVKVSQDVFDFLSLIKLMAGNDLIGNALRTQAVFQSPR